MRLPALIAVFLFATTISADEFRFYTDRTTITPSTTGAAFIENRSGVTVRDIVVTLTASAGLRFRRVSAVGNDWDCAFNDTVGTCRVSRFEDQRFDGVFFEVDPTSFEGGHRSVTARLTADNAPTQVIVFDVIISRGIGVTSAADSGPGSLRAAIEEVNEQAVCGTDVPCNIGIADGLVIAPLTPLPPIRKCNVSLAGNDYWELPQPVKRATISGENAPFGNGLEVRASCGEGIRGVIINGLAIHSWPWNGIYIASPDGLATIDISRSYIGTDATGMMAKPNRGRGIVVESPHDALFVASSIISGNGRSGIALYGARSALIVGNRIGVNRDNEPLGNGASGVFSWGTPLTVSSSEVAHNAHFGVAITHGTPRAMVSYNAIHSNGGLPIDWGLDGRTPPDDESDGILNAPQVTDAVYLAGENRTVVRGTVRLRAGAAGASSYYLDAYLADSERGDVRSRFGLPNYIVTPSADGTVTEIPFEIGVGGDLRDRYLAVQTVAVGSNNLPITTSEMSNGVKVK